VGILYFHPGSDIVAKIKAESKYKKLLFVCRPAGWFCLLETR